MKAYKGFNADMTCRGFQFEEGNTIDDWCRDSKVLENGREKFFKDLKEE